MTRAAITLASEEHRQRAKHWIDQAADDSRVEIAGPQRTKDQNALFWHWLSDIARQYRHHGQKLTPDDYRLIFLDALKREVRRVPALDGRGWVDISRSSSKLEVEEFADLLTLMDAWAAQNWVTLTYRPKWYADLFNDNDPKSPLEAPAATAVGAGAAA